MFNCHKCGTVIDRRGISRRDTCDRCDADLHVCLNCRFHDRSASKQCTETQAGFVRVKDRANFCGWFQPRSSPATPAGDDARAAARKALDDLFK